MTPCLLLTAALATACGDASDNTETTTLPTTAGETASEDAGDDACQAGTAACECFDGMCFDGLECWENICVPGSPPTSGGEEGTGDGDGDGDGDVECQAQTDCPGSNICLDGDPNYCGGPHWVTWSIDIDDYSFSCVDGAGACEYIWYFYRWNSIDEAWESVSFDNLENLYATTYLSVVVYEDDLFDDDFQGEFQFQAADGIEAWKTNDSFEILDLINAQSLTVRFSTP